MKTVQKLPNFIIIPHKEKRHNLISFPGIEIGSFITRDLSYSKMDEILSKLKPYPQHYNRMNELFTIEKQYRKCSELQYH